MLRAFLAAVVIALVGAKVWWQSRTSLSAEDAADRVAHVREMEPGALRAGTPEGRCAFNGTPATNGANGASSPATGSTNGVAANGTHATG